MKEIFEEIDARIKSPLFGYFIFAALAINWEEIFYLVVDTGSVSERIAYFHTGTNFHSLFLYPFMVACAYSILYPWLHFIFIYISMKPTELKNSLQAESEHKFLIKKQDLEEARNKILKAKEVELIDRAKRDATLVEIKDDDAREKLQIEIEQLRKERDGFKGRLDAKSKYNQPVLSKEQEEIIRLITSRGGSMLQEEIINSSKYDKVKTEYFLEDLEENKFLRKNYEGYPVEDYRYFLETISKKMMVDKGFVK